MAFTDQQKDEYVDNSICPYCEEKCEANLTESWCQGLDKMTHQTECSNCHKTWQNHYTLFTIVEEAPVVLRGKKE